MNYRMIAYLLGLIILIEAVFLFFPLLVALIYGETTGTAFLLTIGCALLISFILTAMKPKKRVLYAKEGFVVVALAWIFMSAFGALPFVISGDIPHFVDAFSNM